MAGKWNALTHQPVIKGGGSQMGSQMLLLTDGRVMVHEYMSPYWHALTPDNSGSYVDGTWSILGEMTLERERQLSSILDDGRVIVVGGLTGFRTGNTVDTIECEIYDPTVDNWSPISSAPAWAGSQSNPLSCCVLPNGKFMIGGPSGACAIYDPTTDKWSEAASKAPSPGVEIWVLLADNTILAYQHHGGQLPPEPPDQSNKYIISSDTWQNEGALPVTLGEADGPAMLMYNGQVIFFGSALPSGKGKTGLYTPAANPASKGMWTAGPDIPEIAGGYVDVAGAPASLLPNGKVFFIAGTLGENEYFCEYDPSSDTIAQAPSHTSAVWGIQYMLLLPTGQVLCYGLKRTIGQDANFLCYTPDGGPQNAWRPTISSITPHGSQSFPDFYRLGIVLPDYYLLQGTQLNGLSQANSQAWIFYAATNYPIVRLQSVATNQVYFCRTYNFSTMGVATGTSAQSVRFTVPVNLPNGNYNLFVIANGISSQPVSFSYSRPTKRLIVDAGLKWQFESYGKLIYDGDPWDRQQWPVDPEIVELKAQVKRLQNSVQRLTSLISAQDLPKVGAQVAKEALEKRTSQKKSKSEQE